MIKPLSAALAAILCLAGFARSEDAPPVSPRPRSQPQMVVRAAAPANFRRIFDSRQGRALGLSGADRTGRITGLNTGPQSWRAFLDQLDEKGAKKFWFCLLQGAGVLERQAAGMGWEAPPGNDPARTSEWLAGMGFDPAKMALEVAADRRVTAARDKSVLRDLLDGGVPEGPDRDWADTLAAFMKGNPAGVGVWFNPRPVLGLAALLTGVDARTELARFKLKQPTSASLDFLPDGDHIGITACFNGMLPAPPQLSDDARLALSVAPARPEAVRLTVAAPGEYLQTLGLDRNHLYPLNLDMGALIPRAATLTAWQDDDGGVRWSLVCLMGDKAKFRRQWRRLMDWLDIFAKSPNANVRTKEVTGGGETIRLVRIGDFTLAAKIGETAGAGGDDALLALAGWAEDLPGAADVSIGESESPRLLEWDVSLSAGEKRAVAEEVAFQMQQIGHAPPDAASLAAIIPDSEIGRLSVVGDAVVAESPKSMAAWLAPALPMVKEHVEKRLLVR